MHLLFCMRKTEVNEIKARKVSQPAAEACSPSICVANEWIHPGLCTFEAQIQAETLAWVMDFVQFFCVCVWVCACVFTLLTRWWFLCWNQSVCLSGFCFCFTFFKILLMLYNCTERDLVQGKITWLHVDLLKFSTCDPPFKVEEMSKSQTHYKLSRSTVHSLENSP